MTGSGTIAIEAALKAKNVAPGIWRKFAFDNFDWFDKKLHPELVEEAKAQEKKEHAPILASDIDQSILEIAKVNAHNAGVLQDIKFKQVAVKDFSTDLENGVIVAKPQFEKYFGATATKKRKFYNGNLRTDYYQYWANKR